MSGVNASNSQLHSSFTSGCTSAGTPCAWSSPILLVLVACVHKYKCQYQLLHKTAEAQYIGFAFPATAMGNAPFRVRKDHLPSCRTYVSGYWSGY